jgi:hypothetical protein
MCLLTLNSCVDKIALPETTDPQKIVIECELSPPFHIKAIVATSGDLNANFNPYYPEDATIRLYSEIDEEFVFKYNPDKRIYEVLNARLRPGLSYTMSASLKDTSVQSVYARTSINGVSKIDSIEVLSHDQFINELESKRFNIGLRLHLNSLNLKKGFFKASFALRLAERNTFSGSNDLKYISNLLPTEVSAVNVGGVAVHPIYHMDGIFIDPSRLEMGYIDINIESDDLVLDPNVVLASIYTTFSSVSESYYRYHIAQSKKLKQNGKNPIEPVIDYSNIENGYGFLGSFTSSRDSIIVR